MNTQMCGGPPDDKIPAAPSAEPVQGHEGAVVDDTPVEPGLVT